MCHPYCRVTKHNHQPFLIALPLFPQKWWNNPDEKKPVDPKLAKNMTHLQIPYGGAQDNAVQSEVLGVRDA